MPDSPDPQPTALATPPTHRPPRAVREARRAAHAENGRLTEDILAAGLERHAALALQRASLTETEIAAWLHDLHSRLNVIQKHPEQHLGHIEEQLARATQEPLRLLAQRAAQLKANGTPCHCPECQVELRDQKVVLRTIHSRFGPLTIWRRYGWCSRCEQWHFPADHALGLQKKAPASPYLQEISALLVTKMPAEQAEAVAARLGLDLSRCFLHAEAHRQGLRAQTARTAFLAQLDTLETLSRVGPPEGPPSAPFTLVIEIDAWNIRERDHWGQTAALRAQGQEPSRWHWVYVGTVFRLDHRGQTAGQRPLISQRGYVATRLGIEALLRQLYREALARGLGQAERVLVLADGAVWIWNALGDRFPQALQRLDLWHVDEHLWEVAHDLYGRGSPEARTWVKPLLQAVRDDQPCQVIQTLTELQPRLQDALHKKIQTQIAYFQNHENRMQYKAVIDARKACAAGTATDAQRALAQQPLGTGAIESTCRQYQVRFKRTGQFWTQVGDEALMGLETYWRNDRWSILYPHAQPSPATLN